MAKHPIVQMAKGKQNHYKIQDVCYNCHKLGHFSRNYLDSNIIVASLSNKLPGLQNFYMGIDFWDVKKQ